MIRRSPVAPLLLAALAGTALFAIPVHAEPVEPTKELEAEVTASDLEAVEEWIETPLGQSIIESLPADPSFAPHRRLASLLAMPQFHDWSLSLSNTKLPHFESYLKHMLEVEHCWDIVRREMSEYEDLNALREAQGVDADDRFNRQFVFTVMTDLGYLASLTDQQVADIDEAGRSVTDEIRSLWIDNLAARISESDIGRNSIGEVVLAFDAEFNEAARLLRNPACAMAFQSDAPGRMESIRAGADEFFGHGATHQIWSALREDEPVARQRKLEDAMSRIVPSAVISLAISSLNTRTQAFENTPNASKEFELIWQRFDWFGSIESKTIQSASYRGFQAGRLLFQPVYRHDGHFDAPLSERAMSVLKQSTEAPNAHPLARQYPEWFATTTGAAAASYLPSGYANPVETLLGELLELDEFRRVTNSIAADEAKREHLIAYFHTVVPRWRWDEVDRPRLVVHTVMTDLLHLESLDAAAMQPLLAERADQIETLAQIRRDRLHDLFAPLDLEQTDRELFDRFFEIGMADLNEVAKNPAFLASARPLTDGEMIEAKSYVIQFWDSDLSMLERAIRDLKEFQDNKDAWAERMNEESLESMHQMHYSRLESACETLVLKAIAETAQAVMKPTVQPPLPEAFHAWAPSRSAQASMSNTLSNDKYCLDIVPTIVPVGF